LSGEEKQRRRLAAVMFTDIVGYTKLTQLSEQRTLEALGEHNKIVRDAIAKHGGREVKTIGDSFLAEFDSALEALRCAVDIQQSMRSHWPLAVDGQKMTIRIGIHLGDVVARLGSQGLEAFRLTELSLFCGNVSGG
jgi:class 3 adenylate cyclase